MPQTSAQRQEAWRGRRAGEIETLRLALADARGTIATQADKIARLERERERLYAMLEDAPSDDTGPRAPDCPHPAHLVDGDRCGGCGQVIDSW